MPEYLLAEARRMLGRRARIAREGKNGRIDLVKRPA